MAQVGFSTIPRSDDGEGVCVPKSRSHEVGTTTDSRSNNTFPELSSTVICSASYNGARTENTIEGAGEILLSKMFKLPDDGSNGAAADAIATVDLPGDLQNVDDWFKSKSDSMSSLDFDADLKNSEIDIGDLFNLKTGLHFQISNNEHSNQGIISNTEHGIQPLQRETFVNSVPSSSNESDDVSQNSQTPALKSASLLHVDKGIFEEMLLTEKLGKIKNDPDLSSNNDIDKSSYEEILLPGLHDLLNNASLAERKEILQAWQLGSVCSDQSAFSGLLLDFDSNAQHLSNAEDLDQLMGNSYQQLRPTARDTDLRYYGPDDTPGKDPRWIRNLLAQSNKFIEDLSFQSIGAQEIPTTEENGHLPSEYLPGTGSINTDIDCKLSSILGLSAAEDTLEANETEGCTDLLDTIDKNFLRSDLGITPEITPAKLDSGTPGNSVIKASHDPLHPRADFVLNVACSSTSSINNDVGPAHLVPEKTLLVDEPSVCAIVSEQSHPIVVPSSYPATEPNNAQLFRAVPATLAPPTTTTTNTSIAATLEPGSVYQVVSNIGGNVIQGEVSYQLMYEENVPYLTPCNVALIPPTTKSSEHPDTTFSTSSKSTQVIGATDDVLPVWVANGNQGQNLIQQEDSNITEVKNYNSLLQMRNIQGGSQKVSIASNIPMLHPSLILGSVKPSNKLVTVPGNLLQALQESYKTIPKVNLTNNVVKTLEKPCQIQSPMRTKIVKVTKHEQKPQQCPLNLPKISIKRPQQSAAPLTKASKNKPCIAPVAKHEGKAKVIMSVDPKANLTSVSVISSNQEQTVFKINTCDLVRAVSSIKDFHLEPLGLAQSQLVHRAITANKFIKDIQLKNGLLSEKVSNTGKLSPNQNFEINQVLPEFKAPISRNKSEIKGEKFTPGTLVASTNSVAEAKVAVTAQQELKPQKLSLPQLKLLSQPVAFPTSQQEGGNTSHLSKAELLRSSCQPCTQLSKAVLVRPQTASVTCSSNTSLISAVPSPAALIGQVPIKLHSRKVLSRDQQAAGTHSTNSSTTLEQEKHLFTNESKGSPSGLGVSLLPGASPTMVSIPSVIDSLSPVISTYPSVSALLSPSSKVLRSSASPKTISSLPASLSSTPSVHKSFPKIKPSSICINNPPFTMSSTVATVITSTSSGHRHNTRNSNATAMAKETPMDVDAVKDEDNDPDDPEDQSCSSDGPQDEDENNRTTQETNNGKLDVVLDRALEGVGVSVSAVKAAQARAPKQWACVQPGCTVTYPKFSMLKVHILNHYYDRPHRCTHAGCDWSFASSFKLKRHLETHLNRRDFVCEEPGCGRRFSTVYNLRSHRRMHQLPHQWSCTVPGCTQTFRTKRLYQSHQRLHADVQAPYKCTVEGCTKSYFSASSLTFHSRNHTRDLSELQCQWPNCGKRYDKPCRLKAHLRVHTGQRPFVCDFEGCKWSFKSSSKLTRHKRKHTNCRKFACPMCQKSFLRSEHLKGHLLLHTGVRNFQCTHPGCNAKFTAKSSLYVHLKKHAKQQQEPPPPPLSFHCPVESCNKSYASKSSLREHMLNNHTPILAPDSSHLDYITLVGERGDLSDQLLPPLLGSSSTNTSSNTAHRNHTNISTINNIVFAGDTILAHDPNPQSPATATSSRVSSTAACSTSYQHHQYTGNTAVTRGTVASETVSNSATSEAPSTVSLLRGFELMSQSFVSGEAGAELVDHPSGPTGSIGSSLLQSSPGLYASDPLMGHDLLTDTSASLHAEQTTINLRDLD